MLHTLTPEPVSLEVPRLSLSRKIRRIAKAMLRLIARNWLFLLFFAVWLVWCWLIYWAVGHALAAPMKYKGLTDEIMAISFASGVYVALKGQRLVKGILEALKYS